MDKAQRAKLIRASFKGHGWIEPARPRRAKWWLSYSTGKISRGNVSTGLLVNQRVKAWVAEPDAVPARNAFRTHRTARKSALTKIAEQLPAKLPRVLF
jgi:hypothetical protein